MIVVVGASGGLGSRLLHLSGGIAASRRTDETFGEIERMLHSESGPVYVIDAAGVSRDGFVSRQSLESVEEVIGVNLEGAIELAGMFARAARTRPGSSILFLGSVVARLGVPGAAPYAASKAGLEGLVRSLSRELASIPARANLIETGYFNTGMMRRLPQGIQESIVNQIPLRREGTAEELWDICEAVLFNEYITGSVVPITGGL